MPNPARKTVLSLLNGRYAMLIRGSKFLQYICRRPSGNPSCPLDTTLVHGNAGDGVYPASAGADHPAGAALQALNDCKKAGTGPPSVRYSAWLTMIELVLGSKLAWIPCSSTNGGRSSQRSPTFTVSLSFTRHESWPYSPVCSPPASSRGPVTAKYVVFGKPNIKSPNA